MMTCTVEDLFIALGGGFITVEQALEVLIDNLGRRKAMRVIQQFERKYLK
jgi:hypothetical protein